MTLIKHQLQEQRYVTHSLAERNLQQMIREQLLNNRHNYTHFATITFKAAVAPVTVVVAMNQIVRSLSGINQKKVHFIYFMSLSPDAQFAYAKSNEHGECYEDIIAQWHVHMLLSNISEHVSWEQIEKVCRQKSGPQCEVLHYDGREQLANYVTEPKRGNLIGMLVQSNDASFTCLR